MSNTTPVLLSISAPVEMTDAIPDALSSGGQIVDGIRVLVFEGDSLTAASSNSFADQTAAAHPEYTMTKSAVSGSRMEDVNSRAATVDSLYNANHNQNILFLLDGINDVMGDGKSEAQLYSDLAAYWAARRAVGWKVVACTLLPAVNTGWNAKRATINTMIKSDPSLYDYLADYAAEPTVGVDGAENDTNLYSDGVHLNVQGHALLFPVCEAALLAVAGE